MGGGQLCEYTETWLRLNFVEKQFSRAKPEENVVFPQSPVYFAIVSTV